MSLRDLAANATPGPWVHRRNEGAKLWRWVLGKSWAVAAVPVNTEKEIDNARLIALAPEMCVLLADAKDVLRRVSYWDITVETERCPLCDVDEDEHEDGCEIGALLARIEELEGRA